MTGYIRQCQQLSSYPCDVSVVLAANASLGLPQDTVPPAGTNTNAAGTGGSGAADGTSHQGNAPEDAIPNTAPLLDSYETRETVGSQPSVSSCKRLLASTGLPNAEDGSSTITAVDRGRSDCESPQDSPTPRTIIVVEPSREGPTQDAEREESPRRLASSLFGGAMTASRQASEEFERVIRDGCIDEASAENVQDTAKSTSS